MKYFDSLIIHHQYTRLPYPEKKLLEIAEEIYKREKISIAKKTNLILCSDYFIRKLNRQYRKIDKATDVLSFEIDDSDLLGEIYISLERAKVQARRFEISYDDEIIRLFVHGMFHLQGYDHQDSREREMMESKEHKYLKL
jgi:probable rRNA maturation factor